MKSGPSWEKKEARCTAADKQSGHGEVWDVDIVDVASRAVIARRHGPRTEETIRAALADAAGRMKPGHVPRLITTDEYSPYAEAILVTFGTEVAVKTQSRNGCGRPPLPAIVPPADLVYAQVDKQRDTRGKVKKIKSRLVFGTQAQLEQRLAASEDSRCVNTAFVERRNGVDRGFNPRKARRAATWSKKPSEHRAVSWLAMALMIFCWGIPGLTKKEKKKSGCGAPRSSAMALGRARAVLSVGEFARLRPIGFETPTAAQILGGNTEFHKPEPRPARLDPWPAARSIRKSYRRLGISIRGHGKSTYSGT